MLDDVRGVIRRFRPDVMVFTGALLDPPNVALMRESLWDGTPVLGLADVEDPEARERLRAIGYAEVFAKPVLPDELFAAVRRALDRQRLSQSTGLIGNSAAITSTTLRATTRSWS